MSRRRTICSARRILKSNTVRTGRRVRYSTGMVLYCTVSTVHSMHSNYRHDIRTPIFSFNELMVGDKDYLGICRRWRDTNSDSSSAGMFSRDGDSASEDAVVPPSFKGDSGDASDRADTDFVKDAGESESVRHICESPKDSWPCQGMRIFLLSSFRRVAYSTSKFIPCSNLPLLTI